MRKHPVRDCGALKLAEDKLEREFVLMNGDTYLALDYQKLIAYFQQCPGLGVITVCDNAAMPAAANITISPSGLVCGYDKHNAQGMTHLDAGVMVFKKGLLAFIPQTALCSLEEEVFPKLIEEEKLYAFAVHERFYDMGDFTELEALRRLLQ